MKLIQIKTIIKKTVKIVILSQLPKQMVNEGNKIPSKSNIFTQNHKLELTFRFLGYCIQANKMPSK